MSYNFREQFANLSDEELLAIANINFADYRQESIDAAKDELKKRGFVLVNTGNDFNIITPAGVTLTSSNLASHYPEMLENDNSSKAPKYAYVLAIVVGIIVPVMLLLARVLVFRSLRFDSLPYSDLIFLAFFLLTCGFIGAFFGNRWPIVGWKWGLWFGLPMLLSALPPLFKLASDISSSSGVTSQTLYTTIGGIIWIPLLVPLPACVGAYVGQRRSASEMSKGNDI